MFFAVEQKQFTEPEVEAAWHHSSLKGWHRRFTQRSRGHHGLRAARNRSDCELPPEGQAVSRPLWNPSDALLLFTRHKTTAQISPVDLDFSFYVSKQFPDCRHFERRSLKHVSSVRCLHAASWCCVCVSCLHCACVTLQGVWPLEGEQLGPGETGEQWLFLTAGPRVPPDH